MSDPPEPVTQMVLQQHQQLLQQSQQNSSLQQPTVPHPPQPELQNHKTHEPESKSPSSLISTKVFTFTTPSFLRRNLSLSSSPTSKSSSFRFWRTGKLQQKLFLMSKNFYFFS
jgi:hypothetical protein